MANCCTAPYNSIDPLAVAAGLLHVHSCFGDATGCDEQFPSLPGPSRTARDPLTCQVRMSDGQAGEGPRRCGCIVARVAPVFDGFRGAPGPNLLMARQAKTFHMGSHSALGRAVRTLGTDEQDRSKPVHDWTLPANRGWPIVGLLARFARRSASFSPVSGRDLFRKPILPLAGAPPARTRPALPSAAPEFTTK
jgi:hypothetical protein